MDPQLLAALKRFAKAGIAGAIGGAVLAVQALGPAAALTDAKVVLYAAVTGACTGAIMAVEKYLTWTDALAPQ